MSERLFLGIQVPPVVQSELEVYKGQFPDFGTPIRWTNPENQHVTLAFFGEVEGTQIDPLGVLMKDALQDVKPFTLHFEDIIFAPPKHLFSMLWARYSSPEFNELVTTVETAASKTLELPDSRHFREPVPHITLARFKLNSVSQGSEPPTTRLRDIQVNECYMYRSSRKAKKRAYTPVESFKFR